MVVYSFFYWILPQVLFVKKRASSIKVVQLLYHVGTVGEASGIDKIYSLIFVSEFGLRIKPFKQKKTASISKVVRL